MGEIRDQSHTQAPSACQLSQLSVTRLGCWGRLLGDAVKKCEFYFLNASPGVFFSSYICSPHSWWGELGDQEH